MRLILYSTSHCHLCEQAEDLLNALSAQYFLEWETIEIAEDERLLNRYGSSIPVISRAGSNVELGWPFIAQNIINRFELVRR